jgi:hypothetical protein
VIEDGVCDYDIRMSECGCSRHYGIIVLDWCLNFCPTSMGQFKFRMTSEDAKNLFMNKGPVMYVVHPVFMSVVAS